MERINKSPYFLYTHTRTRARGKRDRSHRTTRPNQQHHISNATTRCSNKKGIPFRYASLCDML